MDSEAQQSKQAVPKFTSFKPKVPLRAEESRDEKRHPSSARRERSTERHHRDHRGPREHRHHRESSSGKSHADYREHRHRRHHDEHRHHRDGRALHERQVVHATSTQGDAGDLYVIDTKGDKYNVVYGSLHQYDVPHYRRAGRGRVLGIPLNYWIDRDSLDGKTLVLQTHANVLDDGSARKSRDAAWKHARKATKLYRVMQDTSAKTDDDLQKDFLSLEFGRASKRRRLDFGEPSEVLSSSEDELNYRSIEGKAKTPQLSELGLEADAAAEEDPVGAAARAKNAELTKRLSEHPNDVNAWLALIEHQGELVGHVDIEGHRRLTAAERSSVADVRMSMYEKALKALPSHVPRDRLILGLLEEGAKLWDTKTIANKWRQYLQQYPNYLSLWIRYLNFQQTNFLSFTFENCRSFIVDCIKMTEPTREMAFSAGSEEQKQIRLYLLLRLSLLMRESGFMESAVALWQALLEFTFFRPKHFNLPGDIEAAFSSFGDYWDSEVARIGDPGAKGWDSNASSPVESKADESYSASLSMKYPFASWERAEWRQMRASFLPARSTDETTEDDPYRVILSSDLQDFLADFTSPELSDLLIDAFLLFCRLPPLRSRDTMASKWFLDPFVRNDYSDCRAGMEAWFAMLRPENAEGTSMAVNSFPVQNLLLTPDTLFAGTDWFSAFRNFQQVHQRETSLLDVAWIRRAIRHLVSRLPNNDRLAEYSAALEFACSPAEAKPYIKRLLKQRPSSIRLYNAYALVESANGNADSAEGMLRTTLSMSHGFNERDRSSCVLLWRTWVWDALKQGQPGKAMKLLAFMSSGQVPSQVPEAGEVLSPTEVVKVQKYLDGTTYQGISYMDARICISAMELSALLTYLTSRRDVEKAMEVYSSAEHRLRQEAAVLKTELDTFLESLFQAKSKLLFFHTSTTRLYKPSLIREELSKCLTLFPMNTMFLGLFAWNETRFRIEDRVRSVVKKHTSSVQPQQREDSAFATTNDAKLVSHLFSIFTELCRGVSAGSTAHSVRAAFENAVSSSSSSISSAHSNPSIWKLYVCFELSLGQEQRARDVFFRSLRACPWAKELVLLAFREKGLKHAIITAGAKGLPGEPTRDDPRRGWEEMRKVWNTFDEKELRVHIDLEEWLEEAGLSGDKSDERGRDSLPIQMPHDESSEDEI